MKAATATAAAPAPQAQATKAPAWMSLASLDDLNDYLKKAKIGGERAEQIRRRWSEAQHGAHDDAVVRAAAERDEAAVAGAADDMAHGLLEVAKKKGYLAPVPKAAAAPAAQPPGLVTRYIDPTLIDVREGWNARIDFGDLAELKNSIKAQKVLDGHGLVNDIRVREKPDGRFELIDGERRWTCVLGLVDEGEVFEIGIPAKVEPAASTDSDLIIKMFVANAGKPFLVYEEALYYKRLRDEGWTIAQIEAATGRSDNSIVGALALLDADEDLVDAVVKGEVSGGLAKSIAVNVRGNKARQKELTKKAREAKKTGDSKKAAQVRKEIDDERRAKAARKMPRLQLKARKADEDEIIALGAEVGARLKELMEKLGMPYDTDMHEWISNDRELQIAANFGALEVLKRVMGVKDAKVQF